MAYSWWILLLIYTVVTVSSDSNCNLKAIMGGKYNFVDLTFPLDEWRDGLDQEEISTSNWPQYIRKGTYFHSPTYRQRDLYVTDIASESLVIQLIAIDMSRYVEEDPRYVLRMKDVNIFLKNEILDMKTWPTLIVFKFGWSRYYYEDPKKYMGYDMTRGSYDLPTLSGEVAEWITATLAGRKVVGIGTDLPSVDAGANNSTAVQDIITNAGLYIIDGLNLNYSIPSNKCIAIASPMKIQQGSVPVNVLAICAKESLEEQASDTVIEHKHQKREATDHEHSHSCGHNGHEMEHGMENGMGHGMDKGMMHGMDNGMMHGMDKEMMQSMKNRMAHEMGMEHEMKQMCGNKKCASDKEENSDGSNMNQENENSGGKENKQPEQGNGNSNKTGEPDKQPTVYDGPQKVIGRISKMKEKIKDITP